MVVLVRARNIRGQEEPFGSKVQSPRNFVMGKSLLDELGKGE